MTGVEQVAGAVTKSVGLFAVVWLVTGASLAGCDGAITGVAAGSGGRSAASGGAGGATAVGAQPIAKGNVSVIIADSPTAATRYPCGTAHEIFPSDEPPSAESMGALLVTGANGQTAECTVKGEGTFSVAAVFSHENARANLHLSADAISLDGANVATVSLFDPTLQYNLYDASCKLDFNAGNYTVGNGVLWAAVSCSHLMSRDDADLWCGLSGIIAFRNCSE
jgi:hypothetical protein